MALVSDASTAATWAFADEHVNAERVRTEEARCERYGAAS